MNRLALLAAGSELLSGDVLETNGHWLQRQVAARPLLFAETVVLRDRLEEITAAMGRLAGQSRWLVISGGLGPTEDDLTREAVARLLGRPQAFSPAAWEMVRVFFTARGRDPGPANRRQAMVVEGTEVLENPAGTAPGIRARLGGCTIYALPGVPAEFRAMAGLHLLPDLPAEGPRLPALRVWGIGESEIADRVRAAAAIPPDLPWGTIAREDGVTLRFEPEAAGHPALAGTVERLKEVLAPGVYAEDGSSPLDLLTRALADAGLRAGCAESCTGGMLGAMLTERPGSSAWMLGSLVAYDNRVKREALGVDRALLEAHGAVSAPCAAAMAAGALALFGADLALAVTGVAGPDGGTPDKPVGTVFVAAARRGGEALVERCRFGGDREAVRRRSCHAALLLGLRALRGG